MSATVLVAVGVLGGLGAVSRFLIDDAVSRRAGRAFPFGTLAVNALGAFALGLVVGAAVEGDAYRLVAMGFLGSLTTLSTWMLETYRLGQDRRAGLGAANIAVSLVVGLVLVWAGREIGLMF